VVPASDRVGVSIRGKTSYPLRPITAEQTGSRESQTALALRQSASSQAAAHNIGCIVETPPAGFTSCNILADDGFLEFGPSCHPRPAGMTANRCKVMHGRSGRAKGGKCMPL